MCNTYRVLYERHRTMLQVIRCHGALQRLMVFSWVDLHGARAENHELLSLPHSKINNSSRKHIPTPSGDLSTNPPTSVFMHIRILGLSAGNRWVTKVCGWNEDGDGGSIDESSDALLSCSRRVVISCRRDGPAIIAVNDVSIGQSRRNGVVEYGCVRDTHQ